MSEQPGVLVTIDGRGYRIPGDLDLNDVAALEEAGYSLESLSSGAAIRFAVWRLLQRHAPEITLEEAGAKVPLSLLIEQAEEGPPPIPLPEREARSGTSSVGRSGNGSTGDLARVETREATGHP